MGVDNIFILVDSFQRSKLNFDNELYLEVGKVSRQVIPSMFTSTAAQATSFFLGTLSEMPAVRAFALYAAVSLTFNFMLQITCFIAALTLDARKEMENRFDVLCCAKSSTQAKQDFKVGAFQSFLEEYYAPALFRPHVRYVSYDFLST